MSRAFTLAGFRGSGDDETMPVREALEGLEAHTAAVLGVQRYRHLLEDLAEISNLTGPAAQPG